MSLLFTVICSSTMAEIKLPSFFSDGMVLQQETEAAIWGEAGPGAEVRVKFSGQTLSVTADADGAWKVVFKGLTASKTGAELTIRVGNETRTIQDVLVGEVWLASGQSNMAWLMKKCATGARAKTINNPLIRHYRGERVSAGEPQADYPGRWLPATPRNTPLFSAVAFLFAEKINQELDVPVGIIEASWGGMRIQTFISDEAIRQIPEAKKAVDSKDLQAAAFDPEQAEAEFQQRLKAHGIARQEWIDGGKQGRGPHKPGKQQDPGMAPGQPSTLYQGMIHPFVGYGMRGAIWYQGESNADEGSVYGELLQGLVLDWRARWGTEFSFYWVQLANFKEASTEPGQEDGWMDVQDEQRLALQTIAKSGMAVANDIGSMSIHPGNKKDVGLRLARWALHQDYASKELKSGGKGMDIVPSGPLYKGTQFDGARATVSFAYAEGLKSRDGEKLGRFELAGPDGKWVWGDAEIKGESVVVTAPSVKQAAKVRYAWAMNPEGANLVNEVGLPTSCFSSEVE
jgi:sialate O-acetylesterase